MKLGTTNLPGANITELSPSLKMVVHEFDWSDETGYTLMGRGPTKIGVTGICATEAERLDVIAACDAGEEVNLYFSSAVGETDDQYYRVYTSPASFSPVTATIYRYSFTAQTVVPYLYSAATGERVT